MSASTDIRSRCEAAMPYLRAVPLENGKPAETVEPLSDPDVAVFKALTNGLIVPYLIDDASDYRYVQNRDLAEAGLSHEELHAIALQNMRKLAADKLEIRQASVHLYAALLGGNFEANMLLLDETWDEQYRHVIANDFVVAIPSRDVLGFCDSESADGIAELHEVVDRMWKIGDHLLTRTLYRRRGTVWEPVV